MHQADYKIGDPILHIELRRWADIVLVAPCSANMLAKLAGGLCDNLAVRLCLSYLAYSTDAIMTTADVYYAGVIANDADVHLPSDEHADV